MDLPISTQELESLYRVAVLLTGGHAAAEQLVIDACAQCSSQIESFRNPLSRFACLLSTIRERCSKQNPPAGAPPDPAIDEGLALAQKISALSEPGRSALALFYAGSLSAREIAAVLKFSMEELATVLGNGREQLRKQSVKQTMETAL